MNAPGSVTNLMDAAERALRADAIDNLTWRLREGKDVGGHTLIALLDSELDGSRRNVLLQEFESLLTGKTAGDTRDYYAIQMVERLIERFLLGREDLIEEEVARIERGREEERRVDEYVERQQGLHN